MNKRTKPVFIGILFLLFTYNYAFPANRDTTVVSAEVAYSGFEDNLDSLLNLWYVQQSLFQDSTWIQYTEPDTLSPDIPDSVYIDRLSRIPSVIELSYNNIVRNFIQLYTEQRRENLEIMLGLANYYFPYFEEILDYYNVPTELKYMAVIESALNPRAVSRVGATGMWQFMYGTGRILNLTINSYVDERRDPIKSTHAAARLVKDFYEIYDDWILVIAAYNCGPGAVNKAIRRSGNKKNFWEIFYYLPRETRGHIPAFIAAAYVMNYYSEHNLSPNQIHFPVVTDTIMVNRDLHLKQVAEILNIPLQQLRDMNPQYRLDIIPGSTKSYSLTIPFESTGRFIELEDSIYAYKDSIFFNKNKVVNPAQYSTVTYVSQPPGNMATIYYTVKSGDNLGYISSWYQVRLSDLRYWNNLWGNMIVTGQKIIVYVPKDREDYYQNINAMTFEQKQASIGIVVENKNNNTLDETDDGDYIYYTVKYGDTIWDIANKYPGVSDSDILRINNLANANRIMPGQVIKIKRKN